MATDLPARAPQVADKNWTPQPLLLEELLRHDAIVHTGARLAHAGVRLVLPPARWPR